MSTDTWSHDEDEQDATPAPPVAVATPKPNVYPDPTIPTLVLPNPEFPAKTEFKPIMTEIDAELPSDVKDIMRGFEILRELELKLPKKSPEQKQSKAARISRVKKHLWQLQQLQYTEVTGLEHRLHLGKAIVEGERRRNEDIEKLTAAIEAGNWDDIPTKPGRAIDPILSRLLGDSSLKTAIALARSALANYKRVYLTNFAQAFPQTRLKEIRHAISGNSDLDMVKELNVESCELASSHARSISHNTKVMFNLTFNKFCKPSLIYLINEAITAVESFQSAASEKERAFFADHGLKLEATQLSRQFEPALRQLRHSLNELTNIRSRGGITLPYKADETVLAHVFALGILQ